jgi:hypothetical protein
MKNKWFAGLIIFLVFGFFLAGCDNGSGPGDIVPSEPQGTWVNNVATVTIGSSSITVARTNGRTDTETVISVEMGLVVTRYGTDYTPYTIKSNQGSVVELGLTQDGQTMIDGDGYTFNKV